VAFAFSGAQLKRYCVYVDGFNLYHRCLKHSPYKWLDLKALFLNLNLEPGRLVHMRYFTARVSHRPDDQDVHVRQDVYLRALRTIPEVTIHFGQFKKRTVVGDLLDSRNKPTGKIVKIQKFEEKGSDVNVANYMLADGFRDLYDAAILISNDSDLAGTLDLIHEHIKKPVGLGVPGEGKPTFELRKRSAFQRKISEEVLRLSQFPEEISCPDGTVIRRPTSWA
jgi:hypothetical protein